MQKYAIMTNFINYIDNLADGNDVPIGIRNKVEKYAYKYSGADQKKINNTIKKNNRK